MRLPTTGELNKKDGNVTDAACREPVVVTKHRKPCLVLTSCGHYERLRTGGDSKSRPTCVVAVHSAEDGLTPLLFSLPRRSHRFPIVSPLKLPIRKRAEQA